MREPMTLARFQELADAYGGVVARWPDDYRDAARAMASQNAAREILENASALDSALDTWRVPSPSSLLRDQAIAAAPAPVDRFFTRARLWWSGFGIAAALAGATTGTAAVAIVTPPDVTSDSGTSFGDFAGAES